VYDATGILGFRYSTDFGANYTHYLYEKDALGNITGIMHGGTNGGAGTIDSFARVCFYEYDAWGNATVQTFGTDSAAIAEVNPFRWKSHYFDTETGWYYIDGRYYDPNICGYITVDKPENLLHNAAVPGALNRYGITIDNPIALITAI